MEITTSGYYSLDKQRVALPTLLNRLVADSRSNPNLVVYIRADKDSRYDLVAQVIDGCVRNGISRYSLGTAPAR